MNVNQQIAKHAVLSTGAIVLLGVLICSTAVAGWVNQKVLTLPGKSGGFVSTAVTCADQTAHTTHANTTQVELWNTNSARDICISWSGTPDITTLSSCDVVLGTYAGSGATNIYQTPSSVSFAGVAFKCDASSGTVLRVVEFKGPTAP